MNQDQKRCHWELIICHSLWNHHASVNVFRSGTFCPASVLECAAQMKGMKGLLLLDNDPRW